MMHQSLQEIRSTRLALVAGGWPYAAAERVRIDAHWKALKAEKPEMWNGEILMARNLTIADGVLHGEAFVADYASFVAWTDWGWPDISVYNCFGAALVVASDGALLYGQMAGWTTNAGQTYPPGGTLDLNDVVAGGSVDILGSIERELTEETGLCARDAEAGRLFAVFDGQRFSVAQELRFCEDAATLATRARVHIAAQKSSELADIAVLRRAEDLSLPAPGHALLLAEHLLAQQR